MVEFEWDPAKSAKNVRKHKVDFERASEVFQDPLEISIPDQDHSAREERWITMGLTLDSRLW